MAVARSDVVTDVRRTLVNDDGTACTLYEYAARHAEARALQGRAGNSAYAVPLPMSTLRVVVRHNTHGGILASLRGDRYMSPTRAPHELDVSLALRQHGVPTPEILAYVVYPPGGLLQRSDVCSREIPASRDLAHVLTSEQESDRAAALSATARLIASLARAGARHHDLNAKNILLTSSPATAYVLDVDRMTLDGNAEMALNGNVLRLARSLRKWRDRFGARISERDIAELDNDARKALRG